MAVICQRTDGNETIVYEPPVASVLQKKSNGLIEQFIKYAKAMGLSPEDVHIQRAILPHIALRVDKREGYFVVFHKGTKINEIKQAALTAYWILRFKPFMIVSNDPQCANKYARINEGFAAFYIFSACKQYAEEKHCSVRRMSDRLKKELVYALTYWDLSKESIIMIAETIGEAFFGIPAQGMDDGDAD